MSDLSACFCSPIQLHNNPLFDKRKEFFWKESLYNRRYFPVHTIQNSCHTLYYYWFLPLFSENNSRQSLVPLVFKLSVRMSGTNKRKKKSNNHSQNSKSSEKKKESKNIEFRGPLSEAYYDSDKLNNDLVYSDIANTDKKNANKDRVESSSSKLGSITSNTTKDLSYGDDASPHKPSPDFQIAEDSIKSLTENFKKRRDQFVQNLEKDPNYGLKRIDEDDSYDWAAALIGRGRANKKGFFLLPYLQSGHIVCLVVVLLCTFVYYPGFYLTELPESTREVLRKSLAIVFSVNGILAGYAGWEAKRRNQPIVLWIIKCMLLGGLALNELQQNVPLTMKTPKQDSLLPTSINRK
ncbi:uncharacterized protein Gasu_21150 [Galdieria sulphuraria]|uniref:Uncharacterized protein n=1 Tax=Galdieria sulphuraria TaxID=130081 RepID=M2XKJ3_GALSU|nr:uncharacterized protein Gasu_21150 [Galdieria sulphuraria]EME30657.1 hypothetical protein Gasu_21150 [Galdieria sulphuraria]|eukprot:XP_005707177.1 hypothetical protein Gasu_21150 [Galdieria sulphuraria]